MAELEAMADFFAKRVQGYEEQMLEHVVGCKQGYRELAQFLPNRVETLLDLGVGTGLELAEIYRRYPAVRVTGVDLCQPMLSLCVDKFQAQRPTLLCEDYLEHDFGCDAFDAAVSFETLHHLTEAEKMILYRRLYAALRKGGRYVQGDYAACDAIQEAAMLSEFQAVSAEAAKASGQRVHFDTPFTAEHDCALLRGAGFEPVNVVWQEGNTVLIVADKAP